MAPADPSLRLAGDAVPPSRRRVLLGQLAANGDCVYATTVARQIKADDPDCHLTWAIGEEYRQVIENNPSVDEIWEVPGAGRQRLAATWHQFVEHARMRQQRGEFDDVYLTQVFPDNFKNFDGTVRASIFRGYPRPITVPVTPVIRLSRGEIERVREFAVVHSLDRGSPVVFFECAAQSGQSQVTPQWALAVSRVLVAEHPDLRVVLNSVPPEARGLSMIIDGGTLGLREVAELMRFCALFIGCSSGLTWVCTSDAARRIPMIQLLDSRTRMYGAVALDLEYFGLASDHVIEMRDASVAQAARCALDVLAGRAAEARRRYHRSADIRFDHYYSMMVPYLRAGHVNTFARSLGHVVARFGPRSAIISDLVVDLGARIKKKVLDRKSDSNPAKDQGGHLGP